MFIKMPKLTRVYRLVDRGYFNLIRGLKFKVQIHNCVKIQKEKLCCLSTFIQKDTSYFKKNKKITKWHAI